MLDTKLYQPADKYKKRKKKTTTTGPSTVYWNYTKQHVYYKKRNWVDCENWQFLVLSV